NVTQAGHTIDLTYTGIQRRCVMNMEVVVVDAAGNVSDRGWLENDWNDRTISPVTNEIANGLCHPTGGGDTYCAPNEYGAWRAPGAGRFPRGYYLGSGSCCVEPPQNPTCGNGPS